MKIKELKEYLNQLPSSMDEASVYSDLSIGCCGDSLELGEFELDHVLPDIKFEGALRLRFFEKIPGYKSCRQVAITEANDKTYWNKEEK